VTSRNNQLWLQSWRDKQTDFHQKAANQLLVKFWPRLNLLPGSRIFVPLCGKSLDMIWLAKQGHEVVGIELSPVAVRSFFKENRLKPVKRRMGKLTLWRHGKISIFCGDYFSLKKADLGIIDTIYDRAALTALPETIRQLYVDHLAIIVQDDTKVFLLTTEDAEEGESLDHALGISDEIKLLYAKVFNINLAHVESVVEINPQSSDNLPIRVEYKVYQLTNKLNIN